MYYVIGDVPDDTGILNQMLDGGRFLLEGINHRLIFPVSS